MHSCNYKLLYFPFICGCYQTQNICLTFIQRRPNVFDVGPTLYKCYTNVLCLLGLQVIFCPLPDLEGVLLMVYLVAAILPLTLSDGNHRPLNMEPNCCHGCMFCRQSGSETSLFYIGSSSISNRRLVQNCVPIYSINCHRKLIMSVLVKLMRVVLSRCNLFKNHYFFLHLVYVYIKGDLSPLIWYE